MRITTYIVALKIEADAYRQLYRGNARHVIARDTQGCIVQFPAVSLRPFVTREGIDGVFVIRVDETNRLIDITQRSG